MFCPDGSTEALLKRPLPAHRRSLECVSLPFAAILSTKAFVVEFMSALPVKLFQATFLSKIDIKHGPLSKGPVFFPVTPEKETLQVADVSLSLDRFFRKLLGGAHVSRPRSVLAIQGNYASLCVLRKQKAPPCVYEPLASVGPLV